MDFACGEPFLFSTFVKWTYLSVSSNQSGHISNDLCHLFFSWQSTKLMILGITHHTKLSLLRHCFPVVSCFTMCYIWTCLLSHFFFVSSNFSRSVWAMTKMLVHSVTLMIPYKNLHDLKKNGRTAVPLYILSWFKCCYYLASSLLHSEWRHERQQVISFTATSFFTWHSEGTWCTHPDHQALTLFWIDITIFWPLKIESFMHRYEYPHINPFAPLFI